MKILVIGATGGTGRQIVQEALAQGYEVNALVRSVAKAVDFHRELTREGYKFPLRIDPCLTLLRFQLTGALWRSDQHGFIERCASLASS